MLHLSWFETCFQKLSQIWEDNEKKAMLDWEKQVLKNLIDFDNDRYLTDNQQIVYEKSDLTIEKKIHNLLNNWYINHFFTLN